MGVLVSVGLLLMLFGPVIAYALAVAGFVYFVKRRYDAEDAREEEYGRRKPVWDITEFVKLAKAPRDN